MNTLNLSREWYEARIPDYKVLPKADIKRFRRRLRDAIDEAPEWSTDVCLVRPNGHKHLKVLHLHTSGSWLPTGVFVDKRYVPQLDSGQWRAVEYKGTETTFTCHHGTEWSLGEDSCKCLANRVSSNQYVGPCSQCQEELIDRSGGFGTLDERLSAYSTGRLDPNHMSELYVLDVVEPSDISLARPVVLYGIGVSAKPRIYEHRLKCPSGLEELLVLQGRDEWIVHVEDYLKEHVTKPQGGRRPSYKATEYLTGARRDAWREHLDAAMRHADTITNRYLSKAS